ncbi:uncharacterized protein BDR25DRAFT_350647 [Lindgomyces ingoldianus]|uniref:Uncharacterized protein n=1 Tax=Lindgomyces ingoldianus TaxID=673940 RepID=A0ACB6R935_9PLEO|nr:uncharacterized protein BDR25DRAFT_350647 [Lindgomyces ingoldianus]KAF2475255.1 hypothetical protein BDR25DRAFT_350647 [Lindgomyces ingoldianus]
MRAEDGWFLSMEQLSERRIVEEHETMYIGRFNKSTPEQVLHNAPLSYVKTTLAVIFLRILATYIWKGHSIDIYLINIEEYQKFLKSTSQIKKTRREMQTSVLYQTLSRFRGRSSTWYSQVSNLLYVHFSTDRKHWFESFAELFYDSIIIAIITNIA